MAVNAIMEAESGLKRRLSDQELEKFYQVTGNPEIAKSYHERNKKEKDNSRAMYITTHAFPAYVRTNYALRRIEDGFYLCDDGKFYSIEEKRGRIDLRLSPTHWEKYGIKHEGCEVVILTETTVITATPI